MRAVCCYVHIQMFEASQIISDCSWLLSFFVVPVINRQSYVATSRCSEKLQTTKVPIVNLKGVQ